MQAPEPSGATLVLASASAARRRMLEAAAVTFEIQPSDVDEDTIKAGMHGDPAALATVLAIAKAQQVSAARPGDIVIGSDQTLDFEGQLLSKPADLAAARHQLRALRGRSHCLHSAAAIARDGAIVWQSVRTARLIMRHFSETLLESYLTAERDWVCQSVGAYRLEGAGVQLFEVIEGDYFTILGMPLLDVLGALRQLGAVQN